MPAKTYRWSGNHIPIQTASAPIASGALVFQEGIFGVAITAAATGQSLMVETEGVHLLTVPASTVKGDRLEATLTAESVAVTLSRNVTTHSAIGIAIGDRNPSRARRSCCSLASHTVPTPEGVTQPVRRAGWRPAPAPGGCSG